MKQKLILLVILNLLAVTLNLYYGSVHIDASDVTAILLGQGGATSEAIRFIILGSRLPAAITALLAGAALGVCGLLLQSYFRNPLAGPSILGITSGANLAVAIVTLGFGYVSGLTLTLTAMIGSLAILFLLLFLGKIVRQPITLLIVGILISYLTNAIITLMENYASADGVQSLVFWGMGSFSGVGNAGLPLFATLVIIGLALTVFLIKPLNGWMLGELYARNLGINISHTRIITLLTTGLLAAVTTAYCGPIAFVGLSIPHIARMFFQTDNHRTLIPSSALLGALSTSVCLWLSTLPNNGTILPINALTPLFGVPVIIFVLLRKK